MGRKIAAVVVGYVAMAAFVFVTFTVAFLAMGTEGAFEPQSYEVSATWIISSIVLGLIAAVLGGLICQMIGRDQRTTMVLAGIVLVLGILMAIPTLSQDLSAMNMRTGNITSMEAMQDAYQPPWTAFLNPILGALGVMIGARLKSVAKPKVD